MERDKAALPFGAETLLQCVVRRLTAVVPTDRLIVVAAVDQVLPPLPAAITIARDARPARGPLEGLAAGLARCSTSIDAVYVTSCDAPLLVPGFVRTLFESLGDADIIVPRDGTHFHPLSAVYRPTVLPAVQQLLAADQLRLNGLFPLVSTRFIDVETLRQSDPTLQTLRNLNTPAEYLAALQQADLCEPQVHQ